MLAKIKIPYDELEIKAMFSQGPGGQNVNRTKSAVQIWWHPLKSRVLNEAEKHRISNIAKLNQDGSLSVRLDRHRDFERNKSDAIKILHEKLAKLLHIPKKRIKTKPSKSSRLKRLDSKKMDSEKKSLRKKIL